jgi:hypothetical protein
MDPSWMNIIRHVVETRALTLFQDGYKTPISVERDFQLELRL